MSLVAALGVSSLAVGLASKDTLSHMISGFILIIDRNLRPGDRINLGGTVGDLKEIGLRSTQIQLPDGTTMIVPNSELVNTRVLNLTLQSRNLLCTTQIRIPVSTPFKTVRSICLGILNQMDRAIIRGVKEKPTWVNLHSLAEGYQNIHIGFWVSELNSAASILSDFHEQLLVTLIEKQISFISYPCCPQFTLTRELK
jgi:small-conductance mechanosensitive channel